MANRSNPKRARELMEKAVAGKGKVGAKEGRWMEAYKVERRVEVCILRKDLEDCLRQLALVALVQLPHPLVPLRFRRLVLVGSPSLK